MDARRLLDALIGAAARRGGSQTGRGGLADLVDQVLGGREPRQPARSGQAGRGPGVTVQGTDQFVRKAKDFMARHPGLAEAALMGLAGVLMGSRRSRGIVTRAARLGGLALIGALAYKAYQNYQAGKPLVGGAGEGSPALAGFDPNRATEDDALLFARAMVAAATADGHVDERERAHIVQALSQAGLDAATTRWLDDELASPATAEDLSEAVETPEKAAQVYAAARLAIDPDTVQEREFLRELAQELDLDPQLARRIDDAAAELISGQ
jgi:uncharacterized membrane protein YebE (DUF533 family)